MLVPALVVSCALLVLVQIGGEATSRVAPRVFGKLAASALLLVVAAVSGTPGAAGAALLVGLGLSFAGDGLLLVDSKRAFVAGLVCFLLAHVAYAAMFVGLGATPTRIAVAAVPVSQLGLVAGGWLWPYGGRMRGPLAAYLLAISVMVSSAIGCWLAHPTPARGWLVVAAAAFYASDLCVARERFVSPGIVNRAIGRPLYYGAQLTFAAGFAVAAGGA